MLAMNIEMFIFLLLIELTTLLSKDQLNLNEHSKIE